MATWHVASQVRAFLAMFLKQVVGPLTHVTSVRFMAGLMEVERGDFKTPEHVVAPVTNGWGKRVFHSGKKFHLIRIAFCLFTLAGKVKTFGKAFVVRFLAKRTSVVGRRAVDANVVVRVDGLHSTFGMDQRSAARRNDTVLWVHGTISEVAERRMR
jgi:hypothetical protein